MAFLFLFTGLLVGASLFGLSERERDYYYENRSINMSFLGNRDGSDIYRDNFTGQFYVDDGWEVSRVGTPGFVPHPVDRERLKLLCQQYNTSNLPWLDFMLASFEGREQQLWTNIFQKYELGPKPKEPTWGKGIRKARWADYGRQEDAWEERRNALTPQFEKTCREWSEKRRKYDETHQSQVSRAAGNALLQRALSGGATIFVNQPAPSGTTYRAPVPQGVKPGDTFMVNAGGQVMAVVAPPGSYAGQQISFQGPIAQAQVVQPEATVPTQPQRAAPAPPASSGTSGPPPPYSSYNYSAAPPPAMTGSNFAAPPPAITGSSSAAAPPPAITGSSSTPKYF